MPAHPSFSIHGDASISVPVIGSIQRENGGFSIVAGAVETEVVALFVGEVEMMGFHDGAGVRAF